MIRSLFQCTEGSGFDHRNFHPAMKCRFLQLEYFSQHEYLKLKQPNTAHHKCMAGYAKVDVSTILRKEEQTKGSTYAKGFMAMKRSIIRNTGWWQIGRTNGSYGPGIF